MPWKALTRFFYRSILPLTLVRNWKVVDDSHKMLVMEHELFRHIEIEMFVTRSKLHESIAFIIDTVSVFGGREAPSGNKQRQSELEPFRNTYCHHYPICVRRILPDDTLISMASPAVPNAKEDWYAISMISYHWPGRRDGFFKFANFVASTMAKRFGARAHWAKFNPLSLSENEELYPSLQDFNTIRNKLDPERRFENEWFSQVL